jgi:hypothetical protein
MKNELIALDNLLCLAPKEEHEAIKIVHALHEKKWNDFYEIRKFNRGEPQNTYKNIDGFFTEIINKIPNPRPSNLFPYPFKIYSNSSEEDKAEYKRVQIYNKYVKVVRKIQSGCYYPDSLRPKPKV